MNDERGTGQAQREQVLPHPSPLFSLRFRRCPLDGGGVQFSHKVQASQALGAARAAFHPASGQVPLSPWPAGSLAVCLSLPLLSSRGRGDGFPFASAERGRARESQRPGEKADEAEVRSVGGKRAAKSDGGGDGGRKWQQQVRWWRRWAGSTLDKHYSCRK